MIHAHFFLFTLTHTHTHAPIKDYFYSKDGFRFFIEWPFKLLEGNVANYFVPQILGSKQLCLRYFCQLCCALLVEEHNQEREVHAATVK